MAQILDGRPLGRIVAFSLGSLRGNEVCDSCGNMDGTTFMCDRFSALSKRLEKPQLHHSKRRFSKHILRLNDSDAPGSNVTLGLGGRKIKLHEDCPLGSVREIPVGIISSSPLGSVRNIPECSNCIQHNKFSHTCDLFTEMGLKICHTVMPPVGKPFTTMILSLGHDELTGAQANVIIEGNGIELPPGYCPRVKEM